MLRWLTIILAVLPFLGFAGAATYAHRRAHSWAETAEIASNNARSYGSQCVGQNSSPCAVDGTSRNVGMLAQRDVWNRRADRFTFAAILAFLAAVIAFATVSRTPRRAEDHGRGGGRRRYVAFDSAANKDPSTEIGA